MSTSGESSREGPELEVEALRQEVRWSFWPGHARFAKLNIIRCAWDHRMRAPTQVETLQGKLGDLHGTDLVALRRAYTTLSQHVSALEGEWDGALTKVDRIQTTVVSPEFVAQEVGHSRRGWRRMRAFCAWDRLLGC